MVFAINKRRITLMADKNRGFFYSQGSGKSVVPSLLVFSMAALFIIFLAYLFLMFSAANSAEQSIRMSNIEKQALKADSEQSLFEKIINFIFGREEVVSLAPPAPVVVYASSAWNGAVGSPGVFPFGNPTISEAPDATYVLDNSGLNSVAGGAFICPKSAGHRLRFPVTLPPSLIDSILINIRQQATNAGTRPIALGLWIANFQTNQWESVSVISPAVPGQWYSQSYNLINNIANYINSAGQYVEILTTSNLQTCTGNPSNPANIVGDVLDYAALTVSQKDISAVCSGGTGTWTLNYPYFLTSSLNCDKIILGPGAVLNISSSAEKLSLTANEIVIQNGGVLTHDFACGTVCNFNRNQGIRINANLLTIDSGGKINASARGYIVEDDGSGNSVPQGLGAGAWGAGTQSAGHAGRGAPIQPFLFGFGGIYDSLTAPYDYGSNGGISSGLTQKQDLGTGGGYIFLNVADTLTINGEISASGQSYGSAGPYNVGSGSGGSIYIVANNILGNGRISSKGGDDFDTGGINTGAGGGRIAIYSPANQFSGTIDVAGGVGTEPSNARGEPGSIFKCNYPAGFTCTGTGNESLNMGNSGINVLTKYADTNSIYVTRSATHSWANGTVVFVDEAQSLIGSAMRTTLYDVTGLSPNRGYRIYNNGVEIPGSPLTADASGVLPQFGIILNSPHEIMLIGEPLVYSLGVFLKSPENASNYESSDLNVYFAADFASSAGLTGATLFVWDDAGAVVGMNQIPLSGNTGSANLSVVLPSYGTYRWNYLAVDSLGNQAWNLTNWSVNIVMPNAAPQYSNLIATPAMPVSYSPSGVYSFEATWTDDVAVTEVKINFDGVDYIVPMSATPNVYVFNPPSALNAGTHSYYWWATDGVLATQTPVQTYTIDKAAASCTITAGDVMYPTPVSVSGSCTNPESPAVMTMNSNPVANPYSNVLDAGAYIFSISSAESTNYFAATASTDVVVSKNNLYTLSLQMDPSNSVTYGTSSVVTGSGCPVGLICVLQRNSAGVSNPDVSVLNAGIYSYTYSTSGNINYEAKSVQATLTVAKAQPTCTISSNSPVEYLQQLIVSGSCTNPESPAVMTMDGNPVSNPYTGSPDGGSYDFAISSAESMNYLSAGASLTATVNPTNNYVLSLDISPSRSVYTGTTTTATGSGCPVGLTCTLYRDGSVLANPETATLPIGSYLYSYSTSGNANYASKSVESTLVVTAKIPTVTTVIANPASPITYGTLSSFSCSNDRGLPTTLYINGVESNSEKGVDVLRNAGSYNVQCVALGDATYEGSSDTITYIIDKATPDLTLTLNGVESGISISYPETVTALASSSVGTPILYRNGVDISSENGIVQNLNAGTYVFNAVLPETTNYNSVSVSRTAVIAKAQPTCTITAGDVMYPTPVSVSGSCTNPESPAVMTMNSNPVANPYINVLDAGVYIFSISSAESTNYFATMASTDVVVSKNNLYTLDIQISPADSVSYGTETTATGSGCPAELVCVLQRNSAGVSNPDVSVLNAGIYSYTYSTPGNANYEAQSISKTLIIVLLTEQCSSYLSYGWNHISPGCVEGMDISKALQDIQGQYSSVLVWEPNQDRFFGWSDISGQPLPDPDLNNISIFIYYTGPERELVYNGARRQAFIVNLLGTWFSPAWPYNFSEAIGSPFYGAQIDSALMWNATTQRFKGWSVLSPAGDNIYTEKGSGYFVGGSSGLSGSLNFPAA
jgi:hypothetical protein